MPFVTPLHFHSFGMLLAYSKSFGFFKNNSLTVRKQVEIVKIKYKNAIF